MEAVKGEKGAVDLVLASTTLNTAMSASPFPFILSLSKDAPATERVRGNWDARPAEHTAVGHK